MAAASKNLNVSASMSGKVKTVMQMFAIGFLMMDWPYADVLLWFAVILTIYSGYEYVAKYVNEVKK